MKTGDPAADFARFVDEGAELVDAALDAWLPSTSEVGDLAAAMRHIVFSGGKRLRPNLVFLGCVDVGGDRADAIGAAAAVEMIHAYSLLHDDLPCMDDGELRRGKPCAHLVYGENTAVLAGDALLTQAFEVLAERTPPTRPVASMVAALARAAGWAGMVGGQVADLAAEGAAPDVERVAAIHLGKTAALIAGSLEIGALAGGGSSEDAARLAKVGRDIGLAFQIVDDLLDEEGTTEELGKVAGADAERDKMTWVAAVGVEAARKDAATLVERAMTAGEGGAAEGLLGALGQKVLRRSS